MQNKPLHHKAQRYELQIYMPSKMAWRPVAHSNDEAQIKVQAETLWAKLRAESGVAVRILDRVNGPRQATIVQTWGNPELNNAYGKN